MLEREQVHSSETSPMFSEEIAEGVSAAEKEHPDWAATDREVDKLIDEFDLFK